MNQLVQQYLLKFFSELQHQLPTQYNRKHVLSLNQDGELVLWLSIKDNWFSVIFDDNYDKSAPNVLVKTIINKLINDGNDIL